MKIIKDILYGFIEVDELAQKIVDTFEFQRLRFIKQLGFTHFVFPNAQHTRFEHSIGVYHLINVFIDYLVKNNNIKIDKRMRQILAISGLIHDIGHVSFSHMFDDYIIPLIKDGVHHEYRSIQLINKMNQKYNLGFSNEELKLISNIILGISDDKYPSYIFQIVANKKNELDLDKIDYLMRDSYHLGKSVSFDYKYLFSNCKIINNEISFHVKTSFTILSIFNTRYELHKKYYNHKTVILYEVMATDAFLCSIHNLDYENMFKSDKWLFELTDNILHKLLDFKESKDIIYNMLQRKLYKLVDKPKEEDYNPDDYLTIKKHIGLTNKRRNPMLDINFYNKNDEIIHLDMKQISIFELMHSYEIKEFNILRTI